MAGAIKPARGPSGGPSPSGLADVMETILDKGLVIDSYIGASLAGVEGLTVDARMAVASLNTYACLYFAEAVDRLDISRDKEGRPDTAGGRQQGGATDKPQGVPESAGDALREFAESNSTSAGKRVTSPKTRPIVLVSRGSRLAAMLIWSDAYTCPMAA